jgi:hypothetical protein
MRGRNNNGGGNRKGPNPLSRTYESNGPDVKIRGTAHHIGEKYLQLARDAQSSGDPVMAESFLQHAEHYFRLIAAAQAAQQAASGFQRPPGEQPEAAEELEEEEDFAGGGMDRFASPVERSSGQPNHQPQPNAQPPYPERPYANGGNERPYQERGDRQEGRGQRHERHDRQDRPERHDRNFQDRNYQDRQQGGGRDDQRGRRQGRDYRQDNGGRFERSENRQAEEEPTKGLPAFITSPVRIQAESPPGNEQPESADLDQGEGDENFRQRRRRRRPDMGEGSTEITSATDPVSD